jgi:uncharacterized protein YcfJ
MQGVVMIRTISLSIAATLLAGLLPASQASAQGRGQQFDFARVVDAQPVYRDVQINEPREVCWNEPVRYVEPGRRGYTRAGNAGSTVLGGIIGGVLGNQVGSGDGRRAATAAGVLIGAAIGAEQGRQNYPSRHYPPQPPREYVRDEHVCEWRDEIRVERELIGYDVTYDYNGYIGYTRTSQAPGQEIRVRVSVDPVGY